MDDPTPPLPVVAASTTFAPSRRRLLAVALGACLAPGGARGCEVQAAHFRLIHPWTRATHPDAEHAVLCMSFEDVTLDDRLLGVETPVADGAEPAGIAEPAGVGTIDLPVPSGRATVWNDERVHVRLTRLRLPLHAGRDYPLTLHFAESGVVFARLSVDFDPLLRFAAPFGRFR
jgi:hypothetical protein